MLAGNKVGWTLQLRYPCIYIYIPCYFPFPPYTFTTLRVLQRGDCEQGGLGEAPEVAFEQSSKLLKGCCVGDFIGEYYSGYDGGC